MSRRQESRRARKNSKESVRLALNRGLVRSLVQHGSVETTLSHAKSIKPLVDTLLTIARLGSDIAHRRILAKLGQDKETTQGLLTFAAQINGRMSGFTRIIKLGARRGDASDMARVEWVDKFEVPVRQTQGKPVPQVPKAGNKSTRSTKSKSK